jgi:hypothetical protein
MSVDVAPTIVIRRPRAAVAAYMFDANNDADWTTGVVESRPLQSGRLGRGSRVERISKFLGRRFGYTYEVVDANNDRFVELSVTKPFPMQIRHEPEDVPQGTRVRIRARGEASSFFRIAAPLLGALVRRNISKDLALLKQRLEAVEAAKPTD